MSADLNAALGAWRERLGDARILLAEGAQRRYGACTTGRTCRIPAAVTLHDSAEVRDIVAVARRYRVPLYPICTGNNWGYGTATPVIDGCVIVDLSAMKRIEFDRDLGLATLEPGVTQGELRAYLDREAPNFMVPVTGAGPNCSLVGNALERGYGITPYADHFSAVMSLEAVLPDGSLYRSALAEAGGDTVDRAFKWSIGPYLDGLFAQGNMGIVTQMTIALALRPRRTAAFFFELAEDSDLEAAVDAVQALLRSLGGVLGSINLMNARRILAMLAPYPVGRQGSDGVLGDAVIADLATQHRAGAWTGIGALYGEPAVVRAARKIVRNRLKRIVKRIVFLTPEQGHRLNRIASMTPFLRRTNLAKRARALDATLRLMTGGPSEVALPLAYWRSGKSPPAAALDPARDGCGLIWYPPLVPMKSASVRRYVTMVHAICRSHGIEPLITLTSLSDRCFDSSVPLLFDRTDAVQTAKAAACYDALFDEGRREGFLPYRLGSSGMAHMVTPTGPFWKLVRTIKDALDPDEIIAPGRYTPLRRDEKPRSP